jgi:hypothetical protein
LFSLRLLFPRKKLALSGRKRLLFVVRSKRLGPTENNPSTTIFLDAAYKHYSSELATFVLTRAHD